MRIAILGAGAVGSYFGGRLAQSGEEVLWLARGATLHALRTRGLRVQSVKGDFVLPPQRATARVQEIGRVEMGPWGSFESDVELARGARQRERCSRLQRAFTCAGGDAVVHDDIRVAAWEKFLFIAALSALGAVTGHTVGELRSRPEARELLRRAMAEIESLARASGVALAPDVVERSLGFIDRLPAESTSSMQRDIRDGRPSELESQSGAVVRLGRERGIETPVHAELVASLRARVGVPPVDRGLFFRSS